MMRAMEVSTYQHAGLTIRVWAEEYIEEWMSPRHEDAGLLGVMFCDHPDYNLGDEDAPDPREQEVECDRCGGEGEVPEILDDGLPSTITTMTCPKCEGSGQVDVPMVEYLKREHGARVILPLFLYDHSGITMRAGGRLDTGQDNLASRNRFPMDSAGWDTSTVGVIFDTAESRERCGWTERGDDEIEADLRAEVELYSAFLEGQVYGYSILRARDAREDEDAIFYVDPETGEEIDNLDDAEVLESCGGFLDPDIVFEDKSYTIAEAKGDAEACAKQLDRERAEAFRWACADVVTVHA